MNLYLYISDIIIFWRLILIHDKHWATLSVTNHVCMFTLYFRSIKASIYKYSSKIKVKKTTEFLLIFLFKFFTNSYLWGNEGSN